MQEGVLLDAREERAYRLLVGLAAARATDLAEVAELPAPEAAEVLQRLQAKGLVAVTAADDPVFRPLPPDVALGTTLLRRQESLEAARKTVAALSEEFRASASRRDAHHLVEVVVGATALRERLRDLQESARQEILWFCRANPLAMQGADNTEEYGALSRGVRYRAIYERALLATPGELDSIAEGVSWGEEARTLPTLPVRLAIVDRATAVCPLVRDDELGIGEPTAAVINRGQLLDALLALFESHWEQATPVALQPSDQTDPGALDEHERFLLSLLVAGVPDKSIASQLGISRRTVQRRLDRLMTLAGVDTRTGLAYQAAKRDWL
ncbi:TrmB family transcriptional regulator [Kribbella sandramycini]|uniref:DNA-binding CsgD family transcriptional regulator n=1 Tax=Kribbella sandramycini TaxID=60450 RepID=A0A7Y4L051_9ACTN|nr:helix-turn-helix domain-containing protein [Kribbella sandramycini]MBB6565615.1 DNA-binding CsgD family transcriptional regulator [Kribbella sandramycini]NOL41878.1 TrmB family transcriptional regulator [Kribbella sandramycini]